MIYSHWLNGLNGLGITVKVFYFIFLKGNVKKYNLS